MSRNIILNNGPIRRVENYVKRMLQTTKNLSDAVTKRKEKRNI